MKRSSLVLASVLLLCLSGALVLAGEAATGKTHDVTVQLVSMDAKAKTVTFKTPDGQQKTAPVNDAALKTLEGMKAGDSIMLTCADNDKGEHQMVTMAKPAPKKAA